MLEFYVGITGALILLVAVTTSISGFARLAYSLGEHGQLPRSFGRLSRRAHVSPQAIVAAAVISSGIVIATSFLHHDVAFLASLFSFGVLIAFTAAQLAVIKLRISEPDLVRPYRVPFNVRIRGAQIPLPVDRRRDRDRHDLRDRARDPSRRPLRRAGLARDRPRRLRRRAASPTARG